MTLTRSTLLSVVTLLTSGSVACSSSSGVTPSNDAGDSGHVTDAGSSDSGHADAKTTDASKADTSTTHPVDSGSDTGTDALVTGTPTLTALSVTGSSDASGITLVPAFSSGVHDYYVRCGAGSNQLTVSMTASTGATSALTQPATSQPAASQTLTLAVTENQAIVAVATAGTTSSAYWVRCLPHDFPELQMNAHPEAGAPTAGYYLVGNVQAVASAGYAMVLDGNGVPVWYKGAGAGVGVVDVDDVVAGAISFDTASTTAAGSFQVDTLNPASTATLSPSGYTTDEHELRLLSNGDYLVLSYPLKSGVDLTGLSIAEGDAGSLALGPDSTIQDCTVVEFDPTGTVTWTWNASDHFDPKLDSTLPLAGFGPGVSGPDGGPVYDVFHCNAIDVDPANGNLLVSAREMDSIFYIEKTSGNVLWKMGGASASLDNATYVTVADPFFRQHDARFQPGWSACNGGTGQISLFDDETAKPGPARGVVYDVIVGGSDAGACDAGAPLDGGVAGQATVAWQYKGSVSTAATGSFRILADGSRVIDWGLGGVPGLVFSEVTLDGKDLLDFNFTDGNASYRTIKVPLSTFDINVLRSTAGGS